MQNLKKLEYYCNYTRSVIFFSLDRGFVKTIAMTTTYEHRYLNRHKLSNIMKIYKLIPLLFITTCATGLETKSIKYPLHNADITVTSNKIVVNNKLFAELKCYFPLGNTPQSNSNEIIVCSGQYRGLSIFYYDKKELIWIFPTRGLEADVKKGHHTALGQSDGYFGWISNIKISEDGKYIYYKKAGFSGPTHYIYSVEHGISIKK